MDKMDKYGMDLEKVNIERLKEIFPECVTDGKVNFDALRTILGDDVETSGEKYSFNWVGKSDAMKIALMPSTGTLRPCKDKSKDWDKTENLYIEGDNLEVLKTLEKTYHNQIKMIYIDPPYNTGKDFVYHDDFHDNVSNYLENSEQAFRTNPETAGRFHTDWLNMMYPRLKIARELLKEEGVIFISIDDNEVDNLRKLCDEIFGENNFITEFPRVTKKGGKSTDTYAKNHDYILVYSKDKDSVQINGLSHIDSGFKNKDEYFDKRGPYKQNQPLDYNSLQYNKTMDYEIVIDGVSYVPGGSKEAQIKRHNGVHGNHDWVWRWSKELFEFGYKNGWISITNTGRIYTKTYLNASIIRNANGQYEIVYNERTKPISTLEFVENKYSNDNSNKEITALMGSALFDYVKPTALVKQLLKSVSDTDSIILDLFSGSATTAHAVMQLNAEDGGHRKFIMVQLPEVCGEQSEAYKAGYKTICDIGEERIRRAGAKIQETMKGNGLAVSMLANGVKNKKEIKNDEGETVAQLSMTGMFDAPENVEEVNEEMANNIDVGFKVFKLDSTNIKPWDATVKYDETTLYDLQDSVVKEDRSNLDIAYEVMLKYGIFNMPLEEKEVNGKTVYSVGEGYMIISLNDEITTEDVAAIAALGPKAVVFKESGFVNDNAKMNADYTFKRLGIDNVKCI